MKSSFLLILSLMAGCEVWSEGCREGWSEFTCTYPKTNHSNRQPNPRKPRKMIIQQHEDFWDQQSELLSEAVLEYEAKDKKCLTGLVQNAYTGNETTITCGCSGNKYKSKFFCRDYKFFCEGILSRNSSLTSNGRFTLTDTESGLSASISNVSSVDDGVYWCGVEYAQEVSLKKIQLKVKKISVLKRNLTTGQNFTYWCHYQESNPNPKFICKGEDPSTCQLLARTTEPDLNPRFSMSDDRRKKRVNIYITEVTTKDTGTYWCGVNQTDGNSLLINKLFMTVVSSALSTTPVPSTEATTVSAESPGGYRVIFTVISSVAVLLLLVAVLILIYKRWPNPKHTTNAAAEKRPKENNIYEEMPKRLQNPYSENAMSALHITADLPADPTASLHYSTIHFKSSPDQAGGESLIRPSSSACQYSTVKYSRSPRSQS